MALKTIISSATLSSTNTLNTDVFYRNVFFLLHSLKTFPVTFTETLFFILLFFFHSLDSFLPPLTLDDFLHIPSKHFLLHSLKNVFFQISSKSFPLHTFTQNSYVHLHSRRKNLQNVQHLVFYSPPPPLFLLAPVHHPIVPSFVTHSCRYPFSSTPFSWP